MQKNSVKVLYQDWASLKKISGFATFSRNVSQPPANVWKELKRVEALGIIIIIIIIIIQVNVD